MKKDRKILEDKQEENASAVARAVNNIGCALKAMAEDLVANGAFEPGQLKIAFEAETRRDLIQAEKASNPKATVRELAQKFRVSKSQIQRDLVPCGTKVAQDSSEVSDDLVPRGTSISTIEPISTPSPFDAPQFQEAIDDSLAATLFSALRLAVESARVARSKVKSKLELLRDSSEKSEMMEFEKIRRKLERLCRDEVNGWQELTDSIEMIGKVVIEHEVAK